MRDGIELFSQFIKGELKCACGHKMGFKTTPWQHGGTGTARGFYPTCKECGSTRFIPGYRRVVSK